MGGTVYAKVDSALGAYASYTAFRQGNISVAAYQKWIEVEGSATETSLNQDQINLSARFPHDKHEFVRRAMAQCRAVDVIVDDRYEAEFAEQALAEVDAKYDHGNYTTYIFPEENALLYAIVRNVRPRRAACMGSYYGYWAMAAKAAHPDLDLTLLDVDPAVMQLARKNFEILKLERNTAFLLGSAEQFDCGVGSVDLLILDAEGPKSKEVPEDYRDKAIYYPLLRAACAILAPGALVIAHNVILSNFTNGAYFEEKQLDYRKQYMKFLTLLREHFIYTVIDSTEGILVARMR
jgi:predicted O-methyltransferase YrrM